MSNEDDLHIIEGGINTDVLLEFMNGWLDDNPNQGIRAVKITHCRYPHHRNEITFFFDYEAREDFISSGGNTSFSMPLLEYQQKSRHVAINNILDES